MTILAVAVDRKEGVTWLGSDTLAVRGGHFRVQARVQKWTVVQAEHGSPVRAVGISGNEKARLLVSRNVQELEGFAADNFGFLFADWFRKKLDEDGFKPDDKDPGPKYHGQCAICVCDGRVWSMTGDFCVNEIGVGEERFAWAEGIGMDFALGAYHAMSNSCHSSLRIQSELTVRSMVEAAMAYDLYCGGEVWTHKIDGGGGDGPS